MDLVNIAEQIVDYFAQLGVTNAFCVTGGAAMHLNAALAAHPRIEVTYNHHESASVMCAEGYARISGRPAIVCVTSGPGALNSFNGIFGAFTDSIPVIVLAGQVRSDTLSDENSEIRQLGDQEVRSLKMVPSITKSQFKVTSARDLPEILPQAWISAISGRPGPVWIEVPVDIQAIQAMDSWPERPNLAFQEEKPDKEEIEKVLSALRNSKRPVVLAGSGVRLAKAIHLLQSFIDLTGIPVMSAWTHDVIDNKHNFYFGRPGTIGTRDANLIMQQSDLLLVLGSRLNIRQVSYNHAQFAKNAYVIQIDIDKNELNKDFPKKNLTITSNISLFLEELIQGARHLAFDFKSWVDRCQVIKSRYAPKEQDYFQQDSDRPNPYHVIQHLFAQAPDNAIFACGNASACILPFQVGSVSKNQRLFSNSGSASMGYDLPAAIGAAIASRDRPVYAICGDGSLLMNVQELATVMQEQIPLKILVLDNAGYLSIRQTQSNFFGVEFGSSKESGLSFPDFHLLANAFGIPCIEINGRGWKSRLDEFAVAEGPVLGWAKVDRTQGFEPRLKSKIENGVIITPEPDDMFPFLNASDLEETRAFLRGE